MEPHDASDDCAADHCFYHHVDEPIPMAQLSGAQVCIECGHYYASGEVLADVDEQVGVEDYGLHPEWGPPRGRRDPSQIFTCPLCCHDF
jgi:hypothetical protein